jgi:hypothetical protein
MPSKHYEPISAWGWLRDITGAAVCLAGACLMTKAGKDEFQRQWRERVGR